MAFNVILIYVSAMTWFVTVLVIVVMVKMRSQTIFAQVCFKYFLKCSILCLVSFLKAYLTKNLMKNILGDKVYDLIGLELGQAIGALILLFLIIIAG